MSLKNTIQNNTTEPHNINTHFLSHNSSVQINTNRFKAGIFYIYQMRFSMVYNNSNQNTKLNAESNTKGLLF